MGSVISLSCSKKKSTTQDKDFSNKTFKISKTYTLNDQDSYYRLFPNLPDELSIQILARLPRICYSNVRLVSWRWRSAVSTSELFTLRKQLGKTEEWLYVLTKGQDDNLLWYALDPVSTRWQRLPPLPVIVYEEESTTSNKLVEIADGDTKLLGRVSQEAQLATNRSEPIPKTLSHDKSLFQRSSTENRVQSQKCTDVYNLPQQNRFELFLSIQV